MIPFDLPPLLLSNVFNHLWQSTVVGAVAGLLTLALRSNRAYTRHWLWLIASVKFLIPFSLLVAIGSRFGWSTAPAIAPTGLSMAMEEFGQPFAKSQPNLVVAHTLPASHLDLLPALLFAVWFVGLVAVLWRWCTNWLTIRSTMRGGSPLPLDLGVPVLSTPRLGEPGVFGIWRPVLMLPEGITEHLAPAQLSAILAHELCHIRRRDNLAAAVHMIVEAIFWFHPLVWWIGERLVHERECACDEEVLRMGNEPGIYAESILKTCQFYLQSRLACVSGVTGSDLKQRVVRIMNQHSSVRVNLSKKLLLAGAGVIVVALPLAVGILKAAPNRAQSPPANATPPLSFDVASIKPTKPGSQGMILRIRRGGALTARNVTLKMLMEEAYGVKDAQISQAPPWFDSEPYDIDAKPEDSIGAAMDKLPREQRQIRGMQMIRSLLVNRFKLVLGHETKDLPVYVLTVAKSGPKLRVSTFKPPDDAPAALPPLPKDGSAPPGGVWMLGPGNIAVNGVDMSTFVKMFSRIVGHIVLDKTGLPGRYDFTLQWAPDEGQGPTFPASPRDAGGPAPPEASGPSLFAAIQEQLGLKLESQKAPLDVLVIQHVEKPSEN